MTLIHLSPTETVQDKPFTDPRFTAQEVQSIRFMASCVWLTLDEMCPAGDLPDPMLVHLPSADRWSHRIIITQPARLRAHAPLTVVGFFGIKSHAADVSLAQELDRQMIPELWNYEDLLGYVSLCLPTGNFGNLVLFTSPEGKEQWGKSEKHAEAVRMLTPDFYAAVRLYNGELPDGIAHPDQLRLTLVKYYDYGARPLWRAVRALNPGVSA